MPKRILVVDDEARIREVVQYGLEKNGFAVEVAPDGRSALARIAQGAFDLVVLDVMLPDVDGYELCRRIRAGGFARPIVIVSARPGADLPAKAAAAGADEFVRKPFDNADLVARVRRHVGR